MINHYKYKPYDCVVNRWRARRLAYSWTDRIIPKGSPQITENSDAMACWLGSEGSYYMEQSYMVGASRQRDIEYPDANPQAVTRVKPEVAPLTPPSHPGEGTGSAEPLPLGRRPVHPAAGQETRALNERRGNRVGCAVEGHVNGAGWLSGVAGTACGESVRREPRETPGMSPARRGNHASWRGTHVRGVGAVHSSEEGG